LLFGLVLVFLVVLYALHKDHDVSLSLCLSRWLKLKLGTRQRSHKLTKPID
jgi:hypothetical protein